MVTSGGRVFTSSNAGATWTLALPPNNGLSLSYLWFDTTNANIVYVASVAPDATKSHLWRSTNGGASFTPIDGGGFPFGVPVNAIKNDPTDPAHLFAGTHLGIYESADSGATWTRFGSGLPLVSVFDFCIAPDGSLMRIATYGRGIRQLPVAPARRGGGRAPMQTASRRASRPRCAGGTAGTAALAISAQATPRRSPAS